MCSRCSRFSVFRSRPRSRVQWSRQYHSSVPAFASKRGASSGSGGRGRQTVLARVPLGHDFEPEVVVEREIEQRAVHVDEHGVDARSNRQRRWLLAPCLYDTRGAVIDLTEKRRLLDTIAGIARDAGRAILEVYGTEFTVTLKDDRSPLTEADKRAHTIIDAGLRALDAAIPVLVRRGRARSRARSGAAGRGSGSSTRSTARRSS